MADAKLTELVALTGANRAANDLFYVVDVSATTTGSKYMTTTEMFSVVTIAGLTITDATDIALGTTTGTKIGTATDQKLGFFGVTPIVQPIVATDAVVATLIEKLTLLGLIKNS